MATNEPRSFITKTPSVPILDGSGPSFTRSFIFPPREPGSSGYQSDAESFEFTVPPEAPVFRPTAEEFHDTLAYINQIRPIAEKAGICKIIPPKNWLPPFAVDVDRIRFTPRIQRLNELDAKTRIKLNFLDQIAKFWELQGSSLKIPIVEKRALDLYTFHRLVQLEGGAEAVTREKKWENIAVSLGYQVGRNIGTLLKPHYEKILYPYDVFIEGEKLKRDSNENEKPPLLKQAKEYKVSVTGPVGRPPLLDKSRRTRRLVAEREECSTVIKSEKNSEMPLVDVHDIENRTEMKRLEFYGTPGPKMSSYANRKVRRKSNNDHIDPLAKYICHNCSRGDDEENMLLCDGCDDSYHTFCLIPPLTEVPKGDWHCPKCLVIEVSKPTEAFGFEQAQREYSLHQFGEMADQFKSEYFNMPVHLVPTHVVEKEFWRIVASIDEDVAVEYGADLHTMDHGSGFPTETSINLQFADVEYVTSDWNLNNIPILKDSVLRYINADISGMKVPWMYVGMCFATFCWHNEDHWSYSINFLHWGEAKTWYGVPGTHAVRFEETIKRVAPELFHSQPDLLHQLVTIMNPNILMNAGIPVFRTDQEAGEFVITFPRAYHAGFNQGYNFAEAVNFAPADWIKFGRECILHYGNLRRFCVFSHDELICKMSLEPEKLNPLIAIATYKDMFTMMETEKQLRKPLVDWGVTKAKREPFEALPDDERQCEICKTTCFLSAVTCPCNTDTLVCLRHYKDLCKCPPKKRLLRYRYTLDELSIMMKKLKVTVDAFDKWQRKVRTALTCSKEDAITLAQMKNLVTEYEKSRFPKSDLMPALRTAIEDGEKCASIIQQLESSIRRKRTRNSNEKKYDLSFEELQQFIEEVNCLLCVVDEVQIVKNLLADSCQFEAAAKLLLTAPINTVNVDHVQDCINQGITICIELPSLPALHVLHAQTKWLSDVQSTHKRSDILTLEVVQELIQRGQALNPDDHIEDQLLKLRTIEQKHNDWELRATILLKSAKNSHTVLEISQLLDEAKVSDTFLPSAHSLQAISNGIEEWRQELKDLNNAEYYPYFDILQSLYSQGMALEVSLPELSKLEQDMTSSKTWLDKTVRIFLRKNSVLNLMESLCPRTPLALMSALKCRKVSTDDDPNLFKIPNDMHPATLVKNFNCAEEREIEGLRSLRVANMAKSFDTDEGCKFCICQRAASGVMMQCELCKDWFHSTCVVLPKIASYKVKKNFTAVALKLGFNDCKFICCVCQRTKRPRLEIILTLLVSLQKLPVRIPEGEALQLLTERAMAWQDHVKALLRSEELLQASAKLNLLAQRIAKMPEIQQESVSSSDLSSSEELNMSADIDSDDSNSSSQDSNSCTPSSTAGDDTLDEHAYSLQLPTANSSDSVLHLSDETRLQLEDTLLEGDLLEIALDETHTLWTLLQASRHPARDIILKDFSKLKTNQPIKKLRKRRLEEADSTKGSKPVPKEAERKQPKRKAAVAANRKRNVPRKKKVKQHQVDSDDDASDQCAFENCILPAVDEVDWVQCDGGCNKWFHMACVGLSAQEVSEDEDYICLTCSQTNSTFGALQSTSTQESSFPSSSRNEDS